MRNMLGSCGQLMMTRAIPDLPKQRASLSCCPAPAVTRTVGKPDGTRGPQLAEQRLTLGVSILSLNSPSKAKDGPSSTEIDEDHEAYSVNKKN